MRQLKYHEKKLLRKVDFLQWKNENNQRELQVSPRCSGAACGTLNVAQSQLMHSSLSRPDWPGCVQIIRRYHIQNRDDYKKYNKICGMVTKLVSIIKRLDPKDPTRIELTDQALNK